MLLETIPPELHQRLEVELWQASLHQEEALQQYAIENKKEHFSQKKSLKLDHGTIGFRLGTPKVVKSERETWSSLFERLKSISNRFVRTAETVNKDAIIDARADSQKTERLQLLGKGSYSEKLSFVRVMKKTLSTKPACRDHFLSWHKRVRQRPYDLDAVSLPVLDQLDSFFLQADRKRGLLLQGPVGVGKTTLMRYFGFTSSEKRFSVVSTASICRLYQERRNEACERFAGLALAQGFSEEYARGLLL